MPNMGVCAWGAEKSLHISRGLSTLQGPLPRDVCIKSWVQPSPSLFDPMIFLGFLLPLSSLKILRKHRSSSFFAQIFIRLSDSVGLAHGCSWCSFIWHLGWAWEGGIPWEEAQEVVGHFFLWWLGTPPMASSRRHCFAPHYTRLALARSHHFLLGPCSKVCHHWRSQLGAYFGGVWSFPLSLSTPLSFVFIPLVRTHYRKRLANLMGIKRPVVEVLTWHDSEVGGSMSFKFLHDRFHLSKCPIGYWDECILPPVFWEACKSSMYFLLCSRDD